MVLKNVAIHKFINFVNMQNIYVLNFDIYFIPTYVVMIFMQSYFKSTYGTALR